MHKRIWRKWRRLGGGVPSRHLRTGWTVGIAVVVLGMAAAVAVTAIGPWATRPAHAQTPCPYSLTVNPTVSIDNSTTTLFQLGQTITVQGAGYQCNAPLTLTISVAGQTTALPAVQVTTDATGSFQTSYAIPAGSLTGSPYPLTVKVYDVYATLLATLTLHSCQDKGVHATPLTGCGPGSLIQDSSSYSALQPLEQDAEQHIASLRGIANDTTNVYFSRGEIRADMLLHLLSDVKTCGQSESSCASSADHGVVQYYADAVKQQRTDVALLADELYEGPAGSNGTHQKDTSFCIPGTTSCGWYSWQHNTCGFLVPLGSAAIETGPNSSDSEQLEYQTKEGCNAPCINPNTCSPQQPSFNEFTGWAAAAMLEVQVHEWAEALMAVDPSYTSLASAETQVQNEYIAAVAGYREGTAFLTAQHASVPNTGATVAEQDLQEIWLDGFGDFEKDQFLDLSKAEITSIVEGLLGEVFAAADDALITTSETLVPLLISAVLTTSVGLYVTITQSQEGCELESALSAAQSDNLYNDVSGSTKYTDCLGNTVAMSSDDGLALLFGALMASTMPDFSNLRGQQAAANFGPSEVSDPAFVLDNGQTQHISNTFVVENWSGVSEEVSVSHGWFVVSGAPGATGGYFQPGIEYRYGSNWYRAWISGTNLLSELAGVDAGQGQVTGEVNLGCPGTLLPNGNVTVQNACVTPYPFPNTAHFSFSVQKGDQIEIGGQTRAVSAMYTNSTFVPAITGAIVSAPFTLPAQTNGEVYVLAQPGPGCFTSSSLGSRLSTPDCASKTFLPFDTSNGTASVALHHVRAADDSYTLDSSGQAGPGCVGITPNVVCNDGPTTNDESWLLNLDQGNFTNLSVVAGVSNGQLTLTHFAPYGFFTYSTSGFTPTGGSPSCQHFPIPGTTSQGYQVCGGPTTTAGDSFLYKLCYTPPDAVASLATPMVCSYARTSITGLTPTLTFTPGPKTYGDAPFTVTATSNSPGAMTYTLGSGSVGCTVSSAGLVTITDVAIGSDYCVITASQAGSGGFFGATITGRFHIAKAPLSVTAAHPDLTYSDAAPAGTSYTYTYSGFVYQDTQASVIGSSAPTCTTTYQQGSNAGNYPINCTIGSLSSPHYTFVSGYNGSDGFSSTSGTALSSTAVQLGAFKVNPATLTVTPPSPPAVQYSDPMPDLTPSVSGFVLGQTASIFTALPTCSAATTASFSNAAGTVTTTSGVNSPAGTYTITCSGGTLAPAYASDYTLQYGTGTLTVSQEDAVVDVTGSQAAVPLPTTGSATDTLTATVWDSAANGYAGANTESAATATIGDVTKMYVEFDIYQAGTCLSGAPAYTPVVAVSASGTPGVGTASYSFSQSTPGAFCVVPRVVGSTTGSTNGYYTAPDGQVAGIAFYLPDGAFVTGGGWVPDAGSSNGHGNFGFEAHYNKNGSPKGQFVYVWRGTYNGQAANFIIKSNALASLSIVQLGPTTYQATLQGKCSFTIVSQATGKQLYGEGNDTFIVTVTDGDNGLSQPSASLDSFALTTFEEGNVKLHPIATTPLSRGDVVVHN